MKQLLFIILVFYSNLAFGQIGIIGSTTVTANTPITFSTDDSSQSYVWDTVAVDIGDTLRGTMAQLQGGQFNGSVCYLVKFDPVSNNWYGFTVNGGTFLRVNLGSNPLNTSPSSIDTMGTVNSMITNGGAMWADIVRDTTGLWYAFISNYKRLIRVSFGNSLSNSSPTADTMTIAGVTKGMQISMIRYNGGWLGFLGNDGGAVNNITRLDFGNDITTLAPTMTQLPVGSPAAFTNPAYFALDYDKAAGTWSMLVNNYGNGVNGNGLSRYDFGASLQNNNPMATFVGTLGGTYKLLRGITIIESCDSFYALAFYGGLGGEYLAHLSFNNGTNTNILNTPFIANGLNDLAGTQNNIPKTSLNTFWNSTVSGDTFCVVTSCAFTQIVYSFTSYSMSQSAQVTYTPNVTYTFAPGTYDITLVCDQGNEAHRSHYCKTITAFRPASTENLQNANTNFKVYPNPVSNELTIEGAEQGSALKLCNMIGQQLYSGLMTNKKAIIDTRNFTNGIYFLQIANKDGSMEIRKIIKQ